jgi:hypothetical protein
VRERGKNKRRNVQRSRKRNVKCEEGNMRGEITKTLTQQHSERIEVICSDKTLSLSHRAVRNLIMCVVERESKSIIDWGN